MKDNSSAKELFSVLAAMNDGMRSIAASLKENPCCKYAASGCDARMFGSLPTNYRYDYEAYVEAEVLSERIYNWSANLILDCNGWIFQRTLERRERDGGQTLQSFADVAPSALQELLGSLPALLDELSETAKKLDLLETVG
jgi:hypothetical protein